MIVGASLDVRRTHAGGDRPAHWLFFRLAYTWRLLLVQREPGDHPHGLVWSGRSGLVGSGHVVAGVDGMCGEWWMIIDEG